MIAAPSTRNRIRRSPALADRCSVAPERLGLGGVKRIGLQPLELALQSFPHCGIAPFQVLGGAIGEKDAVAAHSRNRVQRDGFASSVLVQSFGHKVIEVWLKHGFKGGHAILDVLVALLKRQKRSSG